MQVALADGQSKLEETLQEEIRLIDIRGLDVRGLDVRGWTFGVWTFGVEPRTSVFGRSGFGVLA